ncbi:serine/threonine-protein kinase STY8-like isoform X4 [Panicum virgatum]|uniref:serine/threonine-protein kinase STY8-like isoform X4 n=1 Tax=Panicum virgatum TaxID=38727 RepID=UPI0019D606BE|nr:serine/threonine-protein kinase STY8-like isoform X4 [Panicum virgatum]
MEDDDIEESSWPSAATANRGGSSGGGYTDIRKEILDRLMAKGIEEVVSDPSAFSEQLHWHFERLPASYSIDLDVDKPEDVLLHCRILDECANNPDKRPIFHVRFLKRRGSEPNERMMEDLSLETRNVVDDSEDSSARRDIVIHEIIVSSIAKPKLLAELSALLSAVGLNIREAHVFSTTDGFCLGAFVVDGWGIEETDDLLQKLKETTARSHVFCFLSPLVLHGYLKFAGAFLVRMYPHACKLTFQVNTLFLYFYSDL